MVKDSFCSSWTGPSLIILSVWVQGRLFFQAGDEEDLQRWIVPLRVLVKFYDFQNDKRA